jgi:NAD(P)-dependent dehydrogenase (short-subunit alcohol dehydrogenase family)
MRGSASVCYPLRTVSLEESVGLLEGRRTIVTGGSSGVGRATVLRFLAEGAKVAVLSRGSDHFRSLAADIVAMGKHGTVFPVDLADRAATFSAVRLAIDTLGGIDVAIHAAGINLTHRSLSVLDPAEWDRVIDVNLTSSFNLTYALLPDMRDAGQGQLIFISSVSAKRPETYSGAAYIASKSGLNGLVAAINEEERKNGIRATIVVPGLIDTKLILVRQVPPTRAQMDLALQPEDIADACLYLAGQPPRVLVRELEITPTFL